MNFTVQIHNDEDGGYWAQVQEIPGCLTQGDTFEELEANLQEVIELSLEGLIQDYVDSIKQRPALEHGDFTWNFEVTPHRVKTKAEA